VGGCRRRFEALREREEMKNIKLKIGSSGFPVKMFFTTKDTKSTKCGVLIIQKLRVLRALRGEQSKLNLAHYPHNSPKNLKIRNFAAGILNFASI